ncbi:MAG: DEAD/DEAH box helicase [Thermoprotei archaeon]
MSVSGFESLSEGLRRVIASYGYREATEVQRRAIPLIVKGRNVFIVAPTGSGKTEAVFFPLIDLVLRFGGGGIKALYVTPMRALNRDILRRMMDIALSAGLKIAVRHGDTRQAERKEQIESPPDILITTPEMLQAMLVAKNVRPLLRWVRVVVIDEFHELFSSKRGAQLAVALERLVDVTEHDFQRIGLSATIGDLEGSAHMLFGVGRDFIVINVNVPRGIDVVIDYVGGEEDVAKEIVKLSRDKNSIILFTNTRQMAEHMTFQISNVDPSLQVLVHHGSLDRTVRESVEKMLREGKLKFVVSTSSLELGIDIGSVDYVIQFGSPRDPTRLLQRIGRSMHRFGETAKGMIMVTNVDEVFESISIFDFAKRGSLASLPIYKEPLDVLAHQLIGYILERGGTSLHDFLKMIRRSWPYKDLSAEKLVEVSEFLEKIGKIRLYVNDELRARSRGSLTISYYYENLSTIPETKFYNAIDAVSNRRIGMLDEEYTRSALNENALIILAGRVWRVVDIDPENERILLEPVEEIGDAPIWFGETIPVPREVAELSAELRRKAIEYKISLNELGYPLSERAAKMISQLLDECVKKNYPVPDPNLIVIEQVGNVCVLHSSFGTRINRAIAMIVRGVLSKEAFLKSQYVVDSMKILFYSKAPITAEVIKNVLLKWIPAYINDNPKYLEYLLRESNEYERFLKDMALRFGVISKKRINDVPKSVITELEGTPVSEEALKELRDHYTDFYGALEILKRIKLGIVKVVMFKTSDPSPFSRGLFESFNLGRFALKLASADSIVAVVKERIDSEKMRLICTYCGWHSVEIVKNLPDKISCPKCGSVMIAVADPSDNTAVKIANLISKNNVGILKRNDDLSKVHKRLIFSAELVASYGKSAIKAMAGRGIGPKTAARILSIASDERELYRLILKAEIDYARTKRYWSDEK